MSQVTEQDTITTTGETTEQSDMVEATTSVIETADITTEESFSEAVIVEEVSTTEASDVSMDETTTEAATDEATEDMIDEATESDMQSDDNDDETTTPSEIISDETTESLARNDDVTEVETEKEMFEAVTESPVTVITIDEAEDTVTIVTTMKPATGLPEDDAPTTTAEPRKTTLNHGKKLAEPKKQRKTTLNQNKQRKTTLNHGPRVG